MPRTIRRALSLVGALGLVAVLALPVAAQDEAFVRVVHASPDAPNVDVWVDGETVLTDVPFTAVSDYLALPAGTYNVQVTATGDTNPVIEADLTLEAGQNYTAIAMDDPEAEAGVQVIVATEAMAQMPDAAMAQPTMSAAIIGLALLGLAFVTALPLAARRVRS